jgi:hypothetical protein
VNTSELRERIDVSHGLQHAAICSNATNAPTSRDRNDP